MIDAGIVIRESNRENRERERNTVATARQHFSEGALRDLHCIAYASMHACMVSFLLPPPPPPFNCPFLTNCLGQRVESGSREVKKKSIKRSVKIEAILSRAERAVPKGMEGSSKTLYVSRRTEMAVNRGTPLHVPCRHYRPLDKAACYFLFVRAAVSEVVCSPERHGDRQHGRRESLSVMRRARFVILKK